MTAPNDAVVDAALTRLVAMIRSFFSRKPEIVVDSVNGNYRARTFTVAEVAELAHVWPSSVRRWCGRGVLTARKHAGRGWVIVDHDFCDFEAQRRQREMRPN